MTQDEQNLPMKAAVSAVQSVLGALAEMKATLLSAAEQIRPLAAMVASTAAEVPAAVEVLETAVVVLQEAETGLGLVVKRAEITETARATVTAATTGTTE